MKIIGNKAPAGSRAARAALLGGTAIALALLAMPADAQTAREAALERRLQQLERELQAIKAGAAPTQREASLEKRVIELENEMKGVKTDVKTNVVRSGRRDVTVDLYGQVNRGLLMVDDGNRTSFSNVDNDGSSTRFGLRAKAPLDEDISFGANIELEVRSNSTTDINQFFNKSQSPDVSERKLEAWVESKTFGKLSFGQGDTASNSTSEQDLSGTAVATGYSDGEKTAGGFLFANNDLGEFPYSTNGTLSPSIGQTMNNLDGLSRRDRLRYDTPKFYGFSAATSFTGSLGNGANNANDAALFYSGKLGPVKLAAAMAGAWQHNSYNIYNGSISALHDWGVNLTFAAGGTANNGTNRDPRQFYYVKLGYLADIFSIGKTAFAIDWTEQTDMRQNGDYMKAIGGYIVQNFDKQGTEVYLGVKNHSLSALTGDYDDVLAMLTGLRVRF